MRTACDSGSDSGEFLQSKGRSYRAPDSELCSLYRVRTTVVPVGRSCQPSFFGSRRARTIQAMFITGIAKRNKANSSRIATRARLAGRRSALATIRRPVSFRPGVVPKTMLLVNLNSNTVMPKTNMSRTTSSGHSGPDGGSNVLESAGSSGRDDQNPRMICVMPASTAHAAIRSPHGTGSCA